MSGVYMTLLCAATLCASSNSDSLLSWVARQVQTTCVCILHVEQARLWAAEKLAISYHVGTPQYFQAQAKWPVSKLSALAHWVNHKRELAASQGCQAHALLVCPS